MSSKRLSKVKVRSRRRTWKRRHSRAFSNDLRKRRTDWGRKCSKKREKPWTKRSAWKRISTRLLSRSCSIWSSKTRTTLRMSSSRPSKVLDSAKRSSTIFTRISTSSRRSCSEKLSPNSQQRIYQINCHKRNLHRISQSIRKCRFHYHLRSITTHLLLLRRCLHFETMATWISPIILPNNRLIILIDSSKYQLMPPTIIITLANILHSSHLHHLSNNNSHNSSQCYLTLISKIGMEINSTTTISMVDNQGTHSNSDSHRLEPITIRIARIVFSLPLVCNRILSRDIHSSHQHQGILHSSHCHLLHHLLRT